MKWLAVVGLLLLTACNQTRVSSDSAKAAQTASSDATKAAPTASANVTKPAQPASSDFRKPAKTAYSLMEQMVYEHPVSQSDLSKAIADADAAAKSEKEQDIVFALKGARETLSGTKNALSCLVAARGLLKGASDAENDLTHCKAEMGQH